MIKLSAYTLFSIVLLNAMTAMARPIETWFKGSVEMTNLKVLTGEIALRTDCDVILYRVGEEVMVLPAHKIISFNIFDEEYEAIRKFISLQMGFGAQTIFKFYEIIVDGPVSILRQEVSAWASINLDFVEYEYFIWRDEQIVPIHRFRREVYPELISATDGELKRFSKKNRLGTSRLLDVVKIVGHYNTQIQEASYAKNH